MGLNEVQYMHIVPFKYFKCAFLTNGSEVSSNKMNLIRGFTIHTYKKQRDSA